MTYSKDLLIAELTRDEDSRHFPYVDTAGKTTIGVGRNLTDRGVSDQEIAYMLSEDIAGAEIDLTQNLPWWKNLDDVRQRVLLNMVFNMGIRVLLTFTNTLAEIQQGRWADAAGSMRASLWHRQVGARAERLAAMIETGAA